MKKFLLCAAIVSLILAAAAAMAAPVPDMPNELANPCFVSQPNPDTDWAYDGAVQFNGNGDANKDYDEILGRGHIAYVLAPAAGSTAEEVWGNSVRQTVDDTLSPGWNPDLNSKLWDFSGWYYTAQGGAVRVRIGWWDDMGDTKPTPDATPDHYTAYYNLADTQGTWQQFSVGDTWANAQPRWIRVVVELSSGFAGSAAAVDDTDFTSKCVPEPSSLVAMASGLLGFAGLLWRRRS